MSPVPSSLREDGALQEPALPSEGWAGMGKCQGREKHVENVFCLRFRLGASNLLAQLIGPINLQLQLTACTGLRMVIKVLPASSPSLGARPVLVRAGGRRAGPRALAAPAPAHS